MQDSANVSVRHINHQASRHVDELEQAKERDDCGLGDVVREHLDLVVPLAKVYGGEHVGTGYIDGEILNALNRVLVRHC